MCNSFLHNLQENYHLKLSKNVLDEREGGKKPVRGDRLTCEWVSGKSTTKRGRRWEEKEKKVSYCMKVKKSIKYFVIVGSRVHYEVSWWIPVF